MLCLAECLQCVQGSSVWLDAYTCGRSLKEPGSLYEMSSLLDHLAVIKIMVFTALCIGLLHIFS